MEVRLRVFKEGVNASEDSIGLRVPTSSFLPTFDDTSIVSINLEVVRFWCHLDDGAAEELEADCFCPTNIPAVNFPTWNEAPGTPSASDNNSNADAGAGI
jgi:hypothetical protein